MTSDNFTGLAGAPEDKKKIPKKFSYLQNKEIVDNHETYLDFYHFLFFFFIVVFDGPFRHHGVQPPDYSEWRKTLEQGLICFNQTTQH